VDGALDARGAPVAGNLIADETPMRATSDADLSLADSEGPVCLSGVLEEVRLSCDTPDLRIAWSLSETVAARLAAHPNAEAVRAQGDGCSDRVVVQVVLTEGTATNRYLLSGDVEVLGLGLRAVRTLRAGTLLTAEDVVEGEGWFPPSAFHGAAPDVEGAHVIRAIPAGQVIAGEDIGPPPLVRRGETIRVVYRARGLELRTLGTARRDGWMGDRLAVRATGAQHDCTGIVAGPDIVEVDSEGRQR
jgi:flagella basal body P-ring formation protein FlgA